MEVEYLQKHEFIQFSSSLASNISEQSTNSDKFVSLYKRTDLSKCKKNFWGYHLPVTFLGF